MPKDETKKSAGRRVANLIVLTDGKKSILIPLPKTYEDALRTAARHLGGRASQFTLETRDLGICGGAFMGISPEAWDLLKPELKTIRAIATDRTLSINESTPTVNPPVVATTAPPSIQLTFDYWGGSGAIETFRVKLKPTASVKHATTIAAEHFGRVLGLCEEDFRFHYEGGRLNPYRTVADMGLMKGEHITVTKKLLGGKPVIYLYSPTAIEATVCLSLAPEWEFSAVYPVVPIKRARAGQTLQWRVRTREDGTLHELNTGLDAAYLFWEAETNGAGTLSPPSSPSTATQPLPTAEIFKPTLSGLSDGDSVLLSVRKITPYLDAALVAMGLHTEARTSFITYWLPSLLKHEYVALRFVQQAAYERAAPLEIVPTPDVVTRIFMLFKGVAAQNLHAWPGARTRADEPAGTWRDVAGVQLDRTKY